MSKPPKNLSFVAIFDNVELTKDGHNSISRCASASTRRKAHTRQLEFYSIDTLRVHLFTCDTGVSVPSLSRRRHRRRRRCDSGDGDGDGVVV